MTIAPRLKSHLDARGLPYDVVTHPHTTTASEAAEAAHVPGDCLAKSVLVDMDRGRALAVVPSTRQVDLHGLQWILETPVVLASEEEVAAVFDDCATGAVPPVGAPHDLPTVLDERLKGLATVWFEAGDHETLVRMRGADFDVLMADAREGAVCH
ncbi:aminoacyl-tRNA deacylase [Roseovarius salinarum]|uniref:aminoacyl-tRNA deacylase n=1 Tax=Roseovarius salinarum TaxID=1981892 RepID=UPI000C342473|nr:YbaK/EbsC family protein [Roseovarius salinarum]